MSLNNTLSACVIQPTSHLVQNVRRARELYSYIQPDNLVHPQLRRRSSTFEQLDHVPSLNHTLAPFCQLATLRCNATKAMLNVMDRDVMYFLAEASMVSETVGGEKIHNFVEDPILMRCSHVPLEGRICELTLRLDKPDDPSVIPTFVIPDLTKSQFANMEIIAGPPYYRFYAGVPITTRDGVNIGSIAIMDTKPRPNGLTRDEEVFLGKASEQIMSYLETNRQAIEGWRSRKMAQGLEAFISGSKSIHQQNSTLLHRQFLKNRTRPAYGIGLNSDDETTLDSPQSPKKQAPFKLDAKSNSILSPETDYSSSAQSTEDEDPEEKSVEDDSRSHSKTFARAANLLRECLGDLGADGSVCFLSLTTRLQSGAEKSHQVNGNDVNLPKVSSLRPADEPDAGRNGSRYAVNSRVVASSTASDALMTEHQGPPPAIALEDELLRDLMRRYPGGHLWVLDDSSAGSADEDYKTNGNHSRPSVKPRRHSRRKEFELTALRAAFPCARQVLFVPVWDATMGSFAYGCFITTALETRPFNVTTELPFLNSFCSTVMAECSRLDTMMADKQKSDFVGTISHEMRSPLHGILASVEFLADTETTSFQKSLVETIDSCGRTLLDTINHVLDFSKVNSFQKHWQSANKRGSHGSRRNHYLGPENSTKAMSHGAPPLLQLFGLTDVSAVLEEVVDGLVLGHTYNSGIDITDTSKEARGRGSSKLDSSQAKLDDVEIVLHVQQGDWTFMTQPGAVRRIIMNITGNAIKYTSHGKIDIHLEQKESTEDSVNSRLMILTVSDSGKGISPDFLASRLFVPFAQENALAPGTGLGLSIVRSIVLMLGGNIDVKSKIGKGTTVEVTLPMKRPLPGQISTQHTPHSGGTAGSGTSSGDDSLILLQNQASDETVTFYRREQKADDASFRAVQHYVQDWYRLEFQDQKMLESCSVIIVEEEDLEQLMTEAIDTPGNHPALVVMCSVSSRHSSALINSLEARLSSPAEFIARPCGPNKLARSIRQALEKKRAINPRFPQVTNLKAISEAPTPTNNTQSTAYDAAGVELKEMDLSGPGENSQIVRATETFAASSASQNAQMAIRPSAGLRTPRDQMSDHDSFPFPAQSEEQPQKGRNTLHSRGNSFSKQVNGNSPSAVKSLANGTLTTSANTPVAPITAKVDPNVLLVDDNKINLKLLETFLQRKRNYTRITKAEDGQQAVNAVKTARTRYDIIFMDISMPVMNGFEATRAIREHEDRYTVNPGAMIIALTGLASGRDQTEGFDSGCDIYMTKPVSFKEVGKLLDNWETHQSEGTDPDQGVDEAMVGLNLKSKPEIATPA